MSQDRQEDQFPPYPILEIFVAGKVLVRNHTRNVLDAKCGVVYSIVCAVGWHLEMANKNVEIWKINVKDVKIS